MLQSAMPLKWHTYNMCFVRCIIYIYKPNSFACNHKTKPTCFPQNIPFMKGEVTAVYLILEKKRQYCLSGCSEQRLLHNYMKFSAFYNRDSQSKNWLRPFNSTCCHAEIYQSSEPLSASVCQDKAVNSSK